AFGNGVASGGTVDIVLRVAAVAESITVTAAAPSFDDESGAQVTMPRVSFRWPTGTPLDLEMKRQSVEFSVASLERRHAIAEEVVERIASVRGTSDRLRLYEAGRSFLGGEKGFHIRVAELLRESDADLAIRVLTDLAEADAGDAPVIRIVARIADGWGRG